MTSHVDVLIVSDGAANMICAGVATIATFGNVAVGATSRSCPATAVIVVLSTISPVMAGAGPVKTICPGGTSTVVTVVVVAIGPARVNCPGGMSIDTSATPVMVDGGPVSRSCAGTASTVAPDVDVAVIVGAGAANESCDGGGTIPK
jgi:hypothetical protein